MDGFDGFAVVERVHHGRQAGRHIQSRAQLHEINAGIVPLGGRKDGLNQPRLLRHALNSNVKAGVAHPLLLPNRKVRWPELSRGVAPVNHRIAETA